MPGIFFAIFLLLPDGEAVEVSPHATRELVNIEHGRQRELPHPEYFAREGKKRFALVRPLCVCEEQNCVRPGDHPH